MDIRVYNDLALQGALVFEKNEAGFPENPRIGTFFIKDECLFGYIKVGGLETWYPFASKTNSYVHTQGVESLTWTVNHGLGTKNVWYQIKDQNGQILSVGKTDIDDNSFQLNYTTATRGTVVVVAPDTIDVPVMKASLIKVGGTVEINSTGVYINGERVLTNTNIAEQIATAIAPKADKATTYTKTETDSRIQAVVGAAPAALDTLQELAAQLNNDESAVVALTTLVNTKANTADAATKTELTAGLATKANTGHGHIISDVSGLQAALDAKSNTSDIPANATQTVSGFMSSVDKNKLDGIAAGAVAISTVQTVAASAKSEAIAAAAADATTKVAQEATARDTAIATAKSEAIGAAGIDATTKANAAQAAAITTAAADATTKANAAQAAAITAASTDATTKANAAISTASTDATTKANAAQAAAITAAATDATTKANAAQAAAITAASTDATTKANAAQAAAISTAATDATTKANAAQAAAISTAATDATTKVAAETTARNTALALKADKATAYTKTEVDSAVAAAIQAFKQTLYVAP